MRVLYLYQYFSTREGSTGTRSYEFCTHLIGRGHEVTMVAGVSEHSEGRHAHLVEDESIDGIRVLRLGIPYTQNLQSMARMGSFAAYAALASLVASTVKKPDVVFATSTPLTVGVPGLLVSRRFGVPFVFEVRDLWPEIPIALGYLRGRVAICAARSLERSLYRGAREIITLSPHMERGVVAGGADPRHVAMIPNMADLRLFRPGVATVDWRARLRIPSDALVVAHIGAMGYVNDAGQMLDAAALLPDSGIYFVLIGSGSERPGLVARAEREKLSNVRFGGPLPRRQMPDVLRCADVGLLCVRQEPVLYGNSANKFGDYLAAGLPVVVTYPGWQSRLLAEYHAGICADSGAGGLASVLLRLRDDTSLRRDLGAGALRLAQERFARDRLVEQFEQVLVHAVGQDRRREIARGCRQ